jgi:hypothetical protein
VKKLVVSYCGEPTNPLKMRIRLVEKDKLKYYHWLQEKPITEAIEITAKKEAKKDGT